MEFHDWNRVHEQILVESLKAPSRDEMLAAAGLLFGFRIVFNKEVRELTEAVEGFPATGASALTLERAAEAVARVYNLEPGRFQEELRAEWVRVRDSDAFDHVRKAVLAHRFVDRLEPFAKL